MITPETIEYFFVDIVINTFTWLFYYFYSNSMKYLLFLFSFDGWANWSLLWEFE